MKMIPTIAFLDLLQKPLFGSMDKSLYQTISIYGASPINTNLKWGCYGVISQASYEIIDSYCERTV